MAARYKTLLVTVTGLLLLAGCGRKAEAVKYNNAAAGITKELEATGSRLGQDLERNAGDPVKMKQLSDDAIKQVAEIIKRGRALTPPSTTEGQALHQAFLDYLNIEEEILNKDLPKLVQCLAQSDRAGAASLANGMKQKEDEKLNALKSAQGAFAKANNIQIK